jgi:hypothetical protein
MTTFKVPRANGLMHIAYPEHTWHMVKAQPMFLRIILSVLAGEDTEEDKFYPG